MGCSALFLWLLLRFASSYNTAALSLEKLSDRDELPALELEAPLLRKGCIFLAKPGICSIRVWLWGAIWGAYAWADLLGCLKITKLGLLSLGLVSQT